MELDQLIPEQVTITKNITGVSEDRILELTLRPFNLEDESWLKRAYPGNALKEAFESMNMDAISRIGFHQLKVECKKELMKIKFMDMDEEGNEIEISKTGPQKLAQLIVGYPEQLEFLKALLKTRGFSMPIIEELGDHIVNEVEGNLKALSKN